MVDYFATTNHLEKMMPQYTYLSRKKITFQFLKETLQQQPLFLTHWDNKEAQLYYKPGTELIIVHLENEALLPTSPYQITEAHISFFLEAPDFCHVTMTLEDRNKQQVIGHWHFNNELQCYERRYENMAKESVALSSEIAQMLRKIAASHVSHWAVMIKQKQDSTFKEMITLFEQLSTQVGPLFEIGGDELTSKKLFSLTEALKTTINYAQKMQKLFPFLKRGVFEKQLRHFSSALGILSNEKKENLTENQSNSEGFLDSKKIKNAQKQKSVKLFIRQEDMSKIVLEKIKDYEEQLKQGHGLLLELQSLYVGSNKKITVELSQTLPPLIAALKECLLSCLFKPEIPSSMMSNTLQDRYHQACTNAQNLSENYNEIISSIFLSFLTVCAENLLHSFYWAHSPLGYELAVCCNEKMLPLQKIVAQTPEQKESLLEALMAYLQNLKLITPSLMRMRMTTPSGKEISFEECLIGLALRNRELKAFEIALKGRHINLGQWVSQPLTPESAIEPLPPKQEFCASQHGPLLPLGDLLLSDQKLSARFQGVIMRAYLDDKSFYSTLAQASAEFRTYSWGMDKTQVGGFSSRLKIYQFLANNPKARIFDAVFQVIHESPETPLIKMMQGLKETLEKAKKLGYNDPDKLLSELQPQQLTPQVIYRNIYPESCKSVAAYTPNKQLEYIGLILACALNEESCTEPRIPSRSADFFCFTPLDTAVSSIDKLFLSAADVDAINERHLNIAEFIKQYPINEYAETLWHLFVNYQKIFKKQVIKRHEICELWGAPELVSHEANVAKVLEEIIETYSLLVPDSVLLSLQEDYVLSTHSLLSFLAYLQCRFNEKIPLKVDSGQLAPLTPDKQQELKNSPSLSPNRNILFRDAYKGYQPDRGAFGVKGPVKKNTLFA